MVQDDAAHAAARERVDDLAAELDRWDDMTPGERNALVAVHVMGWQWAAFYGIWCDGTAGGRRGCDWNPTTDHNDKTEAVRVFCEKYGRHTKTEAAFADLITGNLDRTRTSTWVATIILIDPADVCRGVLEARAGSEAGHE